MFLFVFIWMFFTGQPQNTQGDPSIARTKHFNLEGNLALQGYDPVSYFSKSPQKGKKEFALSYMGVNYWFVSKENADRFQANPSKYEPAYGGWCAYAMGATGDKVSVDPETYKLIDGKLYLFYNKFFTNTLNSWNKEEATLKKKADQHWGKQLK